jgi:hypothetical protein
MNPLDKYLAKREAAEHPPPLPRSYLKQTVATLGKFCLMATIVLAGLFGLAIAASHRETHRETAKRFAKHTADIAKHTFGIGRAEVRQAAVNQVWKRQTICRA